jgi:hypothetical protein
MGASFSSQRRSLDETASSSLTKTLAVMCMRLPAKPSDARLPHEIFDGRVMLINSRGLLL